MIDDDFVLNGGDLPVPLPKISFGTYCFERMKDKDEDFITIIEAETGQRITGKELLQEAVNIATGMRNFGINRGDSVCIVGRNTFEISAAGLATWLMGAVMAPLDNGYKAYEFQHMFRLIEPKLLICDADLVPEIKKGLEIWGGECPVYSLQEEVDDVPSFSSVSLEAEIESFEPESCDDFDDLIVIVASSGSTGLPKAVGLTHTNLLYQAAVGKRLASMMPNPVFMNTSHFFWVSSVVAFTLSICESMTRILLKEIEDVTVMQAINDYKPNFTLIPPSLINAILVHPNFAEYDLSSIRVILTGGSPLQQSTVALAREKLGPHIIMGQAYGLSELGGSYTSVRPDWGTVTVGGIAVGAKIKVIDVETGANLPPGEEGELCATGVGLMKCYVNNPEATAEAVDEDRWLHTGDLGRFTSAGQIYITGRMKELFKLDNHQIAPAEIEDVISAVSGVADVGVAGIKVSEDSSHPMALVVRSEGSDVSEEEIIKTVNESLSEHKQLRAGVCFVDAIPRTATGKIIRRKLQELADQLYMGDTESIL